MRLHVIAVVHLVALQALVASARGVTVPATSDPWLAGMPNGATASNGDVAPTHSPVLVPGMSGGTAVRFTVSGGAAYTPGATMPGPDGTANLATDHWAGAENGISNVYAPANALMGVFLGPDRPDLSPAPGALSFATADSRDYATLAPLLKQVFFIGDGLTSTGASQHVIVPAGGTRLFLGPMDGEGWYNNIGGFSVNVAVVPEPGAWTIFLGAATGALLLVRVRRHE